MRMEFPEFKKVLQISSFRYCTLPSLAHTAPQICRMRIPGKTPAFLPRISSLASLLILGGLAFLSVAPSFIFLKLERSPRAFVMSRTQGDKFNNRGGGGMMVLWRPEMASLSAGFVGGDFKVKSYLGPVQRAVCLSPPFLFNASLSAPRDLVPGLP